MEVYYRLSSRDPSVREEASLSLLNDLRLAQSLHDPTKHSLSHTAHANGNGSDFGGGGSRDRGREAEHDAGRSEKRKQGNEEAEEEEEEEEDDDDVDEEEAGEGLQHCSPSVQYALRRLVRGVGSSREVCSVFAMFSFPISACFVASSLRVHFVSFAKLQLAKM
jgi:hypothetical protein